MFLGGPRKHSNGKRSNDIYYFPHELHGVHSIALNASLLVWNGDVYIELLQKD